MYTQKILDILKCCFEHPLFNSSWPSVLSSTLTAILLHRSSVKMEIRKRKLVREDFIKNIKEELLINIKTFKKIRDGFNRNNSGLIFYNKQLLEELSSNDSISTNKDLRSYLDNRVVSKDILTYVNLKSGFVSEFKWYIDLLLKTYNVTSDVELFSKSAEASDILKNQKSPKEELLSSILDLKRESADKLIKKAEILLKYFKN